MGGIHHEGVVLGATPDKLKSLCLSNDKADLSLTAWGEGDDGGVGLKLGTPDPIAG